MGHDFVSLPTVNATYRFRGRDYLVAYSCGDRIRLECLGSNTSKTFTPERFSEQIVKGELILVAQSCLPIDLQVLKSLNTEQTQRRDRRAHYVRYFQSEFEGVLHRVSFDINIAVAAEQINDARPPCYSSVAGWLKRYTSSSNAPTALLDAHMYFKRRSGRLPDQVQHIIKRAIDNVFLQEEAPKEAHVYYLIKAEVIRFNNDFNVGEPLKIPSMKSVRARIDDIDPMRRIERRAGKHVMNRSNRRGGRLFAEDHIGSRCEMDSQLVDVFVVSPHFDIPMRPYLTMVLDVATRCVVGWEFSLHNPSAAKSMRALREAVTHDPFVVTRTIPQKLFVDNGCEFANEALKSSCEYLGMTIVFCSPRQADQKANIERLFGTLNTRFFHTLKGTTKSSPVDRGDYDAEASTVFSMEELKEYFAKHINSVYHLTKHSELGMSPSAKWDQLAAIRPPRTLESFATKGLFLIPKSVSINRGRVRAFGLEWRGPGLPTLAESLSRSRNKQNVILEINPDAIGEAYVLDPTRNFPAQLVQCTLDSKYHQMSLAQVKAITAYQKEQGRKFDLLNEKILASGILDIHEFTSRKNGSKKSIRQKKAIVRKNLHEIEKFIDPVEMNSSIEPPSFVKPSVEVSPTHHSVSLSESVSPFTKDRLISDPHLESTKSEILSVSDPMFISPTPAPQSTNGGLLTVVLPRRKK